jgi:hypothetical protein
MRLVEGLRVVRKFPVPAVATPAATQPAVARETMPETTIDAVAEAEATASGEPERQDAVPNDEPATPEATAGSPVPSTDPAPDGATSP